MQESLDKITSVAKGKASINTLKKVGRFLLVFFVIVLVVSAALAFYVKANKAKILSQITTEISENIYGTVEIGDLNYKFFAGFPNITIALENVVVKDSLWATHKHTLLNAKEIELRMNLFHLFKSEKRIQEVVVNKASIYLFKDKYGKSNSNIFKKKEKDSNSEKPIHTVVDYLVLNKVSFISQNLQANKLFHFEVTFLKSKVKITDDHIKAVVDLDVLAKSMAFNVSKGSFIKDKILKGRAIAAYSKENKTINVSFEDLKIGDDTFDVVGHFDLSKKKRTPFTIDIKTKILWRNASKVLADNISSRLDMFNINDPISAHCTLKGDFDAEGDPKIVVTAVVRDNKLQIPDGTITNCNFDGKFTNNYVKGKGYSDANSAIILSNFSGAYATIPFSVAEAKFVNFDKPIATGKLKSDFDIARLNKIINDEFMYFKKGNAKVNLDFVVDVENYKLIKPRFVGNIFVKNASLKYVPKNLTFEETAAEIYFTEEALVVQKINFKNQSHSVFMEFKIKNFLNLYYNEPEKMLINWKIYSPFLNVKEFIGVLTTNQNFKVKKANANSFSDNLHNAFDKSQVVLDLKVDKIGYATLVATNAKARIKIINNKLTLEDGWIESSGGNIVFDGKMTPQNKSYTFNANAKVNGVTISRFLNSFDNFGIRSFSPESLKGKLAAQASINGILNPEGELKKRSMTGAVKFNINKGALVDFEPIRKGWQLLVPFRDLDNITFSDLKGDLKINGEKVAVNEMRISSNVINFDVDGIYSFGQGTNLHVTVPLRNSKNDDEIVSQAEREEKRYRGIVLHLLAVDGDDGKVKIKLVGNPDK